MPLVKILAHPVSGTVQIARLSSGENATTLAKVSFFAEGAANALFHFQAQNADTAALGVIPPSCLLRVRKGRWTPGASKAAAPPAFVDFKSMVKFLAEDILSALGNEQVVKHEVVELGPGIIDLLDDILKMAEVVGKREEKRRGWMLLEAQKEAFLIEDMAPKTGEDSILFDFKPKWLAQSPSAPTFSVRCRTCAHDVQKKKPLARRFCPLALQSGTIWGIRQAVDKLLASLPDDKQEWNVEDLRQELTQFFWQPHPARAALNKLKELQVENDPYGVMQLPQPKSDRSMKVGNVFGSMVDFAEQYSGESSYPIAKAMTFRDCSFLIKIIKKSNPDKNSKYQFIAKLADFDVKIMNETKLKKWAADELSLIPYYTAGETPKTSLEDEVCVLSIRPQMGTFLYPDSLPKEND
jgi:hypothetical protein